MTKLTDTKIRTAKPKTTPYTLSDGQGLILKIKPNGSKLWRLRFYWNNKQQLMSLGLYPEVSLQVARKLRDEARECIALAIDPRKHISTKKQSNNDSEGMTFAKYVEHWKEFKLENLYAGRTIKADRRQSTREQIERYIAKDLNPGLGDMLLKDIRPKDVLAVLRKIENRNATSIAEKCCCWLNQLFGLAVAEGEIEMNPASEMKTAAKAKPPTKHNPHLTVKEIPQFLSALRSYNGFFQTKEGIRLLFLTGVRTGEARFTHPSFFDLKKELWYIPASEVKQLQRKAVRFKNIPCYIVPLSKQAVELVKRLLSYMHPGQEYLLGHRSNLHLPISENTLNQAIKNMGYQDLLTGHGIRGTISTALNEKGYNKDWVESQLSHSDKDKVRDTYNHAMYVEKRRKMMQDWADLLDELDKGIVPKSLQEVA